MSAYRDMLGKAIENLRTSVKNGHCLTREDEDKILAKIDELRAMIGRILDERRG